MQPIALIPQPLQDVVVHFVELKSLVKEKSADDSQVKETAFKVLIAVRNLFCTLLLCATLPFPRPLYFSIIVLATLVNDQIIPGKLSLSTSAISIYLLIECVKKHSLGLLALSLSFNALSYLTGKWYQRRVQIFFEDTSTCQTLQFETQNLTKQIIKWA